MLDRSLTYTARFTGVRHTTTKGSMMTPEQDIQEIKARNHNGLANALNGGRYHQETPPYWCWVVDYADCGPVLLMNVLWDDTIKKDENFCGFAQDVAAAILGDDWVVGWGKWGAGLHTQENPTRSRKEIEEAAERVRTHPSWLGLAIATNVITYA